MFIDLLGKQGASQNDQSVYTDVATENADQERLETDPKMINTDIKQVEKFMASVERL